MHDAEQKRDLVDAAQAVRAGEEIDVPRLQTFLQTELGISTQAVTVEQFPSGYSNLTYLVRVGEDEYVLRRPPFGDKVASGHDMAREFKVLSRLHAAYPPAPRARAYCDDVSILGAPFYLMERRTGVVLRSRLPKGLSIEPACMSRMCELLVDGLAELHAVDVERVGLSDLGHPQGYVERQVEGWIGRWQRAELEPLPRMHEIATWLRTHMPVRSEAALVHNDYKFDNVMFSAPNLDRVVAVLDWELCTLGDPLLDLGTSLGYWVEDGDDARWKAMAFGPTYLPGAWTRQQVVDAYARRTGRDCSDVVFGYVFGLLKIAVIAQQIYVRYVRGQTKDPRFAGLNHAVALLAEIAANTITRGRL